MLARYRRNEFDQSGASVSGSGTAGLPRTAGTALQLDNVVL